MNQCIGKYFILNGTLTDCRLFDSLIMHSGHSVYEVVRVKDKICLFLEDHLNRLQESINLLNILYIIDYKYIKYCLLNLLYNNDFDAGNIKIVITFSADLKEELLAYFIPFYYPSAKQYSEGVSVSLYHTVRKMPNAKRIVTAYQQSVHDFITSKNVFEALLVNENNCITEGSKSNVFFIEKANIVTPPDELVLKGITRNKILDICINLKYNIIKSPVSINNLSIYQACFITGTSPKVLPVSIIDDYHFTPDNPVLRNIMSAYDKLIEKYLAHSKINK